MDFKEQTLTIKINNRDVYLFVLSRVTYNEVKSELPKDLHSAEERYIKQVSSKYHFYSLPIIMNHTTVTIFTHKSIKNMNTR